MTGTAPKPGTPSEPLRDPVACGALGAYDPTVVAEMARRLGVPMWPAYEDERSTLVLDRAPIEWRRWRGPRGYAWTEAPTGHLQKPRSWMDASTDANACGLVVAGERRFVHSSVSGQSPVFHLEHDGAVYFCSRLDPLVHAVGRPLTPDWDAWASIFTLRQPVGQGTTFAEAGRLHPFTTLEWRDRTRVRSHDWPWAAIEPTLGTEEGAPAVAEALKEVMAPVTGATSMLTGGLDSRMLTGVLNENGTRIDALTLMVDDGGKRREHEMVGPVAAALGATHRIVERDPANYWDEWMLRTEALDYMQIGAPGRAPLAPVLAEMGQPATDGLAIDTFSVRGGRFFTPDMFAAVDSREMPKLLWRKFRRHVATGVPGKAFVPGLARGVTRSSRRQMVREGRPFRGKANAPIHLLYITRTLRGTGPLIYMLGDSTRVYRPGATHRVASAFLAIKPLQKLDRALYNAVMPIVAPAAAELPSSAPGLVKYPQSRELVALRPEVVRHYEELLPRGPLARHTNPELLAAARGGELRELIQNPGFHRATLALATFQLWYERYEPLLGDINPAPLLGEAEATPA